VKSSPHLLLLIAVITVLAFLFASQSWAITLQIAARPIAFPLVVDSYHNSGVVVAWGDNLNGQSTIPNGLTRVVQVSAETYHSIALKSDGTVVAWGDNLVGETNIPPGLTNVVQVSAGDSFSVALKNDGTVVAWGWNSYGQTNIPLGLSNVVQVDAGYLHTLALKSDGTVVAWGWNPNGETTVPVGLTNVVQVSAGDDYSLALKSDGTVVAWGYSLVGETNIPPGLTNVVQISAGNDYCLALKSNGTVVVWGDETWGETTITKGLSNIVEVTAGDYFGVALKSDATVVAWSGNTPYGETNIPPGLTNIIEISGRGANAAALKLMLEQSISPFSPIPHETNGISFSLTPPPASSSLPVTLSILSGPATISSNTVTPTGTGTVILAANQAGNSNYYAAPELTTSFTVNAKQVPITQRISPFAAITTKTFVPSPLETFTINPPISTSHLPVDVTVLSGPATILKDTVTLTGAGTVTLDANQTGNANYLAASPVRINFKVNQANQTITFTPPTSISFVTEKKFALTGTAPGGEVNFTSSSPKVITVVGTTALVLGRGTAILKATQIGNANFKAAAAVSRTVRVK